MMGNNRKLSTSSKGLYNLHTVHIASNTDMITCQKGVVVFANEQVWSVEDLGV